MLPTSLQKKLNASKKNCMLQKKLERLFKKTGTTLQKKLTRRSKKNACFKKNCMLQKKLLLKCPPTRLAKTCPKNNGIYINSATSLGPAKPKYEDPGIPSKVICTLKGVGGKT